MGNIEDILSIAKLFKSQAEADIMRDMQFKENPVNIVGFCDGVIELLKAQPKWIPVTERKPKSMANKVIVYVEHEDLNPQIGYGHYEKFQGVEMWYNLETQEQFSEHGYTVTHWMPMPKSLDGKRLILD